MSYLSKPSASLKRVLAIWGKVPQWGNLGALGDTLELVVPRLFSPDAGCPRYSSDQGHKILIPESFVLQITFV